MFNIRNIKSDVSLKQIKRSQSKSNQRSNSEVKQQPLVNTKINYHFIQKRDYSEGKQIKNSTNQITQLEQIDESKGQAKTFSNGLSQPQQQLSNKNLEFRLPDLRKYQQKPPKPISHQGSANKTNHPEPTQPEQIQTDQGKQITLSQLNQIQLKNRLVMYDDVKTKMPKLQKKPENEAFLPQNSQQNSINQTTKKKEKKINLNFASLSKAGYEGANQKNNQDRELVYLKNSVSGVFAVLDGHGMDGDKVSSYVLEVLKELVQQKKQFDFVQIFPEIHNLVKQNQSFGSQFSGTTLTVAIIENNSIECGWLGDSRAILGRKKSTRKIDPIEISKDHKPNNEGERLRIEKSGGQVESYKSITGASLGPSRVWVKGAAYPGLAMSRSIGDQVAASVGVSQIPDVVKIELKEEDLFIIIASDGVWEFLSNQQVIDLVYQFYLKNDPKGACLALYQEAFNAWKMVDDGTDDITSIIIFLNWEE